MTPLGVVFLMIRLDPAPALEGAESILDNVCAVRFG
jgi:hypothetical protein